MFAHFITPTKITLAPLGQAPIMIDNSHFNFQAVRNALADGDWDEAVRLASVKEAIKTFASGKVEVTEDAVYYNGREIHSYLSQRILSFYQEGLPFAPLVRFMENLYSNPSMTSISELFLFLEAANLPITDDGCFLAYKAVRSDFRDKHTGTIDNSPGAKMKRLERNQVDDNRERTCSFGYHAAAYDYAKNFLGGGVDRMVVVKINPADVVSIPSDYQNQKLRCTYYEVLQEIPGAFDTLTGRSYISDEDREYLVSYGDDDDGDSAGW